MELGQLRCFVTLAEHLHYGQAASRLYLSQSALSKRIAGLERELGVVLFERTRRDVTLTGNGRVLLAEAERVLAAAEGFGVIAERLAQGTDGSLRLGYSGAVSAGALTDILREFRRDSPGVAVSLRESSSHGALLNDVAARVLDAAFVRYLREDDRLETIELRQEPTVVAVSEAHPYFERESLDFAELRDQPLIVLARDVDPEVHAHATALFEHAGFAPSMMHEAESVQTSLAMVAGGLGLAVVTAAAASVVPQGVRCVPLNDPSFVSVWLVHRRGDTNASLERLIASVGQGPVRG